MTKTKKKLTAGKLFYIFFGSNIAIYLSLGLHKGRTSYTEKPSSLKREHPALQNMKILYFFYICGYIFALLDPDTDPLT
jgi:hypothetical protein